MKILKWCKTKRYLNNITYWKCYIKWLIVLSIKQGTHKAQKTEKGWPCVLPTVPLSFISVKYFSHIWRQLKIELPMFRMNQLVTHAISVTSQIVTVHVYLKPRVYINTLGTCSLRFLYPFIGQALNWLSEIPDQE